MDEPAYCAACFSVQPADAAFCLRGGADLSLPPPRPVPPRPPRPREEEPGDWETVRAAESRGGFGNPPDLAGMGTVWLLLKAHRGVARLAKAAIRAVHRSRAR